MFKVASVTDSQLQVHLFNQKLTETKLVQSIDVSAQSIAWSPDNTTLLALTPSQILFIDERTTETELDLRPRIEYHQHLVSKSAFGSKTGRYCFLVNDRKVLVFDRKERKVMETILVQIFD
jgi:WD40 repeat protein